MLQCSQSDAPRKSIGLAAPFLALAMHAACLGALAVCVEGGGSGMPGSPVGVYIVEGGPAGGLPSGEGAGADSAARGAGPRTFREGLGPEGGIPDEGRRIPNSRENAGRTPQQEQSVREAVPDVGYDKTEKNLSCLNRAAEPASMAGSSIMKPENASMRQEISEKGRAAQERTAEGGPVGIRPASAALSQAGGADGKPSAKRNSGQAEMPKARDSGKARRPKPSSERGAGKDERALPKERGMPAGRAVVQEARADSSPGVRKGGGEGPGRSGGSSPAVKAHGGGGAAGALGAGEAGRVIFGGGAGPSFLRMAQPEYPLRARRAGAQGLVEVLAELDADGKIRSAMVLSSPHEALSSSALEAVRRSTFRPLVRNGSAVGCRTVIPIRFVLKR